MVGQRNLQIPREEDSTKWLVDLVWSTAARLGYGNIFVNLSNAVDDDHMPFLHRGVPSVDIIDLYGYQQAGDWHTTRDYTRQNQPQAKPGDCRPCVFGICRRAREKIPITFSKSLVDALAAVAAAAPLRAQHLLC